MVGAIKDRELYGYRWGKTYGHTWPPSRFTLLRFDSSLSVLYKIHLFSFLCLRLGRRRRRKKEEEGILIVFFFFFWRRINIPFAFLCLPQRWLSSTLSSVFLFFFSTNQTPALLINFFFSVIVVVVVFSSRSESFFIGSSGSSFLFCFFYPKTIGGFCFSPRFSSSDGSNSPNGSGRDCFFFLFWVATLFHLDVSCHILQLLYLRLRPFLFSINWEEVPRRLLFFCSYFTFHFGRTRLIAKLFEVGLPISIDIFFISLHKFRRSVSTLSLLLSCVGSF